MDILNKINERIINKTVDIISLVLVPNNN